ncbi:hypothetical protein SE17_35210, partial [Kouleothrix aurantiaca]
RGNAVSDDVLLLMVNSHDSTVPFRLPGGTKTKWELLLDTAQPDANGPSAVMGRAYKLVARSLVLLRQKPS